jgi:hypothetical protein
LTGLPADAIIIYIIWIAARIDGNKMVNFVGEGT